MNKFTQISDFHGERSKGIGSSDIPIILGMTKDFQGEGVKTPLDLWELKTGRRERWSGNKKTYFGHELEPIVCGSFVTDFFKDFKLGEKVKIDKIIKNQLTQLPGIGTAHHDTEARMKKYPWALAHADLVLCGDRPIIGTHKNIIVEAKSHSYFASNRKGDLNKGYDKKSNSADAIPLSIWCQVEWQMMVYDIKVCYVAALIDTNDFRIFGPIKSEPRQQEKMLAKARRFWECVLEDKPPKPISWNDVKKLYPGKTGESITIGGDILDNALKMKDEAKELRKSIKNKEKKLKDIQTALGLLLAGGDVLTDPEGKKKIASRSIYDKESFLYKSFKEDEKLFKKYGKKLKEFIKITTVDRLNF